MLPSPWKPLRPIEPDREYVALLSYLPLKTYRKIPAFVRYTRQVQQQLASTPGVAGYSVQAQPLRRRFWTLSAWESEAALIEFVRHAPHSEVMRALAGQMGKTSIKKWKVKGSELPLNWAAAKKRPPSERVAVQISI
jgi:heme-degrading monooxygenase HmoA